MLIRQFLFGFLLNSLLFSIGFAYVGQINDEQLKGMIEQGAVLIDIRRPEEWKQTGVVEGSHLITFFDKRGKYDIDKWTAQLDKIVSKGQPFVLICRTGSRTGMVTKYLDRKLNYKNVNHLRKGITNWIRKGNTVSKSQAN